MAEFPWAAGVAVVTGAASGIGAALAGELARRGARLALVDKDGDGLERVAAGLAGRPSLHRLDLAEDAAAARLAQEAPGPVHLLINNAGIALFGTFEEVEAADFDALMAINFGAVVRLTRAFLPRLRQAGEARIVNVSSVFGLVAPPGQTAYAASKFAVRGFSEALRAELHGTNVGVSLAHPGGVATRIAVNALGAAGRAEGVDSWNRALRMPPRRAAEIIADGIARRRDRILVGADARALDWAQRLFPVSHAVVLRRVLGA